MKTYLHNFQPKDKVKFIQPSNLVFDNEGKDAFENLIVGDSYTVKKAYILSLELEEVEGIYLKENFRLV